MAQIATITDPSPALPLGGLYLASVSPIVEIFSGLRRCQIKKLGEDADGACGLGQDRGVTPGLGNFVGQIGSNQSCPTPFRYAIYGDKFPWPRIKTVLSRETIQAGMKILWNPGERKHLYRTRTIDSKQGLSIVIATDRGQCWSARQCIAKMAKTDQIIFILQNRDK